MSNLRLFTDTITSPKAQDYLAQVLGQKKSSFVNNMTALVVNSAALQKCEPYSLMYAGIKATALDLPIDPNLGLAYVIPYNNRKTGTTEAQFQIGYKGFVQLAIRSGQFRTINVTEIREGELTGNDIMTGEMTFKAADNRCELKIIGYLAYFKLLNGFEKMLYMTVAESEAHALKYSQTYSSQYESTRKSSKWSTDFDSMAKKTALKALLSKYAPLSVEMRDAIKFDQSVIVENEPSYVDNEQSEQQQQQFEEAEEVEDKKEQMRANKSTVEMP